MRKWFVVLMLFLLPIRGLVGDAMAYSMLPGALTSTSTVPSKATNLVAAPAIFYWATAAFDHSNGVTAGSLHPCHMTMAEVDSNDSVQNQCTACQACHLSAATPLQLPLGLLQTAATLPEQRQTLWHSAEQRLIAKPPVF
jgi:cytochrome c553